ncbi:hypothetical protein ABOZ73_06635 [Caulobacter sp. 73W]|uniref:Uncharacterized protein n=1 Tax=Caulobacter sp. 73W TaxID=3161137 RepID=A0AB39KVQ4_9CAUL
MSSQPGSSTEATATPPASISARRRQRLRREGKWTKRQTFLFIIASIAILWGALIGAGFAVWLSVR